MSATYISRLRFSLLLLGILVPAIATGDERTLTPEQMEALAKTGEIIDETPQRPAKLPDLTKGELIPATKDKPETWSLGPTGIVSIMVGGFEGDQLQVQATLKGSPADGKFLWGDVITGMNGRKFVAGEHLGYLIGNAIIEAEKEQNAGKMTFQVWRDRNYAARFGKQDVSSVDIDKIFDEARDDNSVYEWKPEEERAKEVVKMGFDKFPIDPTTLEVELQLRVMPPYSDTSPYDCPKTNQILEDACKVLESKFVADPANKRSGRGGIIEAIALIAAGRPEHRKLVYDWVRGPNSPWRPPTEPIGAPFQPGYKGYKGMQSWHHGFNGLNCALYYDATGDDFVLPALRKFAIETAMGQSGGGSWGHTFAYPSFNGGELHKMNPGYGALNAAGNRCFFLITLAQKLGIKDPEIDAAVERARRFFGSYVDQGCIPYGDHGAYASDDSNGKNTGVAFSLKLLGDHYGAKYFAQMSTHASFTARGGHGHDYHTNWSGWGATLCGPEGTILTERNMRWRRTLCRMHDGSFVYHSPTGGKYGTLRDPTATEVLHYAAPLKQTLITGKDPDEQLWTTPREMKQLLSSARPQFNDPTLIERDGKPWKERGTDELFELLDIFYPKARATFAAELGKRFQAGEKEIAPRLVKLLASEQARYRDGALRALLACGPDTVLSELSKVTKLLDDPKDFVRITAVNVISKCADSEETQLAMLKATTEDPQAVAPNSVRNATQVPLFGKDGKLAESPFDAGFDEELVQQSLENLLQLDPVGGRGFLDSRNAVWTKDTVVRLAGPLTFVAEEEQINDQMFANRSAPAQAMLARFGYREAMQATAHLLRKKAAIPRAIRPFAGFKRPLIDPETVRKHPAAFREFIEPLRIVLTDNPLEAVVCKDKSTNWMPVATDLDELLALIEADKDAATLPSIASDVQQLFQAKLDQAEGTGAKLKLCRDALKDPARKTYFRQMAAMGFLTETLGADALEDLLPYLGHDYWRLREHSRKLAAGLVTGGAASQLADAFTQTKDPKVAAGILAVFAMSKAGTALEIARQAIKHDEPLVRQAAITTSFVLGGEKVLPEILAHLKQAATPQDLLGCEEALLSRRDDPAHSARVRDAVIAMLPQSSSAVRPTLYYLLARIGDPQCIAALGKAGQTKSVAEFEEVVLALSYSPSREADQLLLDFAATDPTSAKVVGEQAVRRMVLGPAGFGDITSAQRLDFAEAMLKLDLNNRLITYLGHIHEARALRALMYCLSKGVEPAADSLVTAAEGMGKLSPTDARIAAQALQNVIEYIEVTRLRGGISAHMDKDDRYTVWKALQARAGKVLLKVHQPETAPIPGFDPLDLDP
jgi:hypothetical protein